MDVLLFVKMIQSPGPKVFYLAENSTGAGLLQYMPGSREQKCLTLMAKCG